jgi:hypothetical protein
MAEPLDAGEGESGEQNSGYRGGDAARQPLNDLANAAWHFCSLGVAAT